MEYENNAVCLFCKPAFICYYSIISQFTVNEINWFTNANFHSEASSKPMLFFQSYNMDWFAKYFQ